MIAIGLAGMLLGGVIGVGATQTMNVWHDRGFGHGPAWLEWVPRR